MNRKKTSNLRQFALGAIALTLALATSALQAGVTCLFEGATMKVLAPASHVGAHLVLLWDATDKGAHFDGTSTLSFAPGATITVDMGERTPELNDQLTSWSAKPQNVTFAWDLELPLCALRAGLFVKRDPGCTIIFR